MNSEPSACCKFLQKLSFGLGHIQNDLCAAVWFYYTLFYFEIVLQIDAKSAGLLIMIGQVVDALATPLAGGIIHYTNHKRLWHFIGSVSVTTGFSLIFSFKASSFNTSIYLYYIPVIMLFQIGWAIVQISHLSLIPEISRSHSHSTDLTAIRYTAAVCCSIFVFLITLLILKSNQLEETIGPSDFFKFKEIALILVFIGLISTILFYCGLLGHSSEYEFLVGEDIEDANNLGENHTGIKHFLMSNVIYLVSILYMTSKLFTTLNYIYLPLYIEERGTSQDNELDGIRSTISLVPLICNVSSLVTSVLLRFRMQFCSDKITYCFGSLLGIMSSVLLSTWVSTKSNLPLYLISILLGISGSTTMVASLCLTANYVKTNNYSGGLVYSVVTFTDKLISGFVVLLIQNMRCANPTECPQYYEQVLSYICATVSTIGLFGLAFLQVQIKKNGKK